MFSVVNEHERAVCEAMDVTLSIFTKLEGSLASVKGQLVAHVMMTQAYILDPSPTRTHREGQTQSRGHCTQDPAH